MREDIEAAERQARVKVISAELDRRYKMVARQNRKLFAELNDISPSYSNEILNSNNEDNSKPFPAKMIASLILIDPNLFKTECLDFQGDLCGYVPADAKRKLTPEEELAEYKRIITEHKLDPLFEKVK
jgi:hypothetical protein